jgi:hypothetical protein
MHRRGGRCRAAWGTLIATTVVRGSGASPASEESFMPRAKTEPNKNTGDVMESLIERTDPEADEKRTSSEDTLERDDEDEEPEDDDSDDE